MRRDLMLELYEGERGEELSLESTRFEIVSVGVSRDALAQLREQLQTDLSEFHQFDLGGVCGGVLVAVTFEGVLALRLIRGSDTDAFAGLFEVTLSGDELNSLREELVELDLDEP